MSKKSANKAKSSARKTFGEREILAVRLSPASAKKVRRYALEHDQSVQRLLVELLSKRLGMQLV